MTYNTKKLDKMYDIVTHGTIVIRIYLLDCKMDTYKRNDKIALSNGLYVGDTGYFYVMNGTIRIIGRDISDKFGQKIYNSEIVNMKKPKNGHEIEELKKVCRKRKRLFMEEEEFRKSTWEFGMY